MFTTHPQDQYIHNIEDAVFKCAANGSESLTISWTRNDKYISNSKQIKITEIQKSSVLKVKKATVGDSGVYQCIAINVDNETVLSKPAELLSKNYEM